MDIPRFLGLRALRLTADILRWGMHTNMDSMGNLQRVPAVSWASSKADRMFYVYDTAVRWGPTAVSVCYDGI